MLLHKWYCSLTIKQYVLVLWVFNWLPCFFWLEWLSREDWKRDRTTHSSRIIRFRSEVPFLQLQNADEDTVRAIKAQTYPSCLSIQPRGLHAYPSFLWWFIASRNCAVMRVQAFDGTFMGMMRARQVYISNRDKQTLPLAALAFIQVVAMIIPGVQTAHWMARAGWLAGALLAVCGILTGAFTEGIIHLVFEEDLSKGNTGGHDRLNLNADAEILHRVDEVLCMPSTSMIFSSFLFLAGGAIFAGSADSEPPSTTPKRGAFALIAISPSFVYLLSFSIQLLETIYSKRATPQSESEGNTRPISPYSPSLLGLPLAPTTGATGVLVGPSLRTGDLARRVPERKHVAFTPTILFHSMLSSPASPANPLPSATTASQNLSSSILSSSLSAGGFEVVDLDLGGTGIEVTGDISRQPATEVDDLHDRKPYDLLVRYAEMEHRVGKLPGAESAYREAIFGLEQCLGRHHLDTLKAMTGLAEVLYEKGVFEEAETMLSEVLYERERVLGREHPDTQDALSQLANILYHERKVPEAERIYKEVFDRRERALGGGHSDTLDALASLARINYDQGRIAAAQEMYETVISGREKALGQRHSDTLDALACLAKIYFDRGEYPEAIVKFKEVVLGRDSTRGLGAVDALIAIEYLAKIYYKQGNLQEAAELFRGALAERERMQGRDDPDTLTAIDYLHRHLYGTSPPYGRVR